MGSYKKKLFIALLVTLLIGFFVCGSVNAAQTYYQTDDAYKLDPYYYLTNEQENYAAVFVTLFEQNASVIQKNNFTNNFNNYFCYFRLMSRNPKTFSLECLLIPYTFDWGLYGDNIIDTELESYYDTNTLIPVTGYSLTNVGFKRFVINKNNGNLEVYEGDVSWTEFIPSLIINYHNTTVANYKNGVMPSNNLQFMILQAIQENTEETEEVANQVKELNNFMKSEDVDQDAYDMPTNNPTQDPTTEGINNIFNKFYTRITSWDSSSINVYIPFANKSFTIPANASEQLLAKFSNMGLGSTLKSLINAVWFYVLARYIIKDVQKYIDGLKTGEILTKSDTNIKTEML